MKPTCESDHYWEVKRGAVTLCHGPGKPFPLPPNAGNCWRMGMR